MKPYVLLLKPAFQDNIWGGRRLIEEFHMDCPLDRAAEAWVLSCHKDGQSRVKNGPLRGLELSEAVERMGRDCLGKRGSQFSFFPLLIKFIDARDDLSIQVHPNDEYALRHENGYGKTEMWYVMDSDPGSKLYYGFTHSISREEFAHRIQDQTLPEVLNAVEVQRGDCFFIPAGTIHAIGKGLLIAEIQQNSNTTYRVYDYGRRDQQGNTRELHIDKALEVTTLGPAPALERYPVRKAEGGRLQTLADCPYFTTDKIELDGRLTLTVDDGSFRALLCMEGAGTLHAGEQSVSFHPGDCLFVPADAGEISLQGKGLLLLSRV